jgi:hypothetical protein
VATFDTSNLPLDSTITTIYNGGPGFSSSPPSSQLRLTINKSTPTVTIVSNYPPVSSSGDYVQFTALVTTPIGPPTTPIGDPLGHVQFFYSSDPSGPFTDLGSAVVTNGTAVLDTNILPLETWYIKANYVEDSSFNASPDSNIVTQLVNPTQIRANTITTLSCDPNPVDYGCPVTFTITVTPLNATQNPELPCPTGYVSLYIGTDRITTIPLPTVSPCEFPYSVIMTYETTPFQLQANELEIIAFYSGDIHYSSSLDTLNPPLEVFPVSTSLTLAASGNSYYSQPVPFTATVTGDYSCYYDTPPHSPTGSVSFYDGTTLLGTTLLGTTLLNENGVANFITTDLSVGIHSISAVYNPDPNFLSSENTEQVSWEVFCITTISSIVTASPNPSVPGELVTFIAAVTTDPSIDPAPKTSPPSGSITFYDGTTSIGSVNLYNGLAIFTHRFSDIGDHSISFSYSGDTYFCPTDQSSMTAYIQKVNQPVLTTSVCVSSSLNPAEYGNTIVLSASVTGEAHSGLPGIPTGTVTFFDGLTDIGTSILVNGVANLSTSTLSVGAHSIRTIYSGDSNYFPSESGVQPSCPILIQEIIGSSFPQAPHDFYGCQVINKYLNFNDIVNILTWVPPQDDKTIKEYRIYRNASLTDLAGSVKNCCPFTFEDRNRKKNKAYKYYIVSVNAEGKMSPAVKTKVVPCIKSKR